MVKRTGWFTIIKFFTPTLDIPYELDEGASNPRPLTSYEISENGDVFFFFSSISPATSQRQKHNEKQG